MNDSEPTRVITEDIEGRVRAMFGSCRHDRGRGINPDALENAKDRLRIPNLAGMYFPNWTAGASCLSPFREDRNASFSVFDDGRRWHDFATGESGDAIDFLQLATGLGTAAAIAEFKRLAGCDEPVRNAPHFTATAKAAPAPRKPLSLPADLHPGTGGELSRLAALRNVSVDGLRIATDRGLLHFGTVDGLPCWIVTDSTRRNAQARRLDGKLFPGIDAKAKTIPGSAAAWPIGADRVQDFPCVALCEGGPDLLAAFHFIHCKGVENRWTACAMLGASNRIPSEALPLFSGKHIRIFAHLDDAGRQAAERWERQLTDAGARTDIFNLEGIPTVTGGTVGDLNDVCNATPEVFENDRGLMGMLNEGEGVTA